MAEKKSVTKNLELPEGVKITVQDFDVTIEGPKGKVTKKLLSPITTIKIEGNGVTMDTTVRKPSKRERTALGTVNAHIKNMIKGVTEGHLYKLKICSGHFPMNVSVSNKKFIVKNFLGEKFPREIELHNDADVKINGNEITVESNSKEVAGQVAASIDQICRITNRDRRIFQDGIYIIEKDGKAIK